MRCIALYVYKSFYMYKISNLQSLHCFIFNELQMVQDSDIKFTCRYITQL